MFKDAYEESSRIIPNVVPVHGSKLPAAPNNTPNIPQNLPKSAGFFYRTPPPQTVAPPQGYSDFYDRVNDLLGKFTLWFGGTAFAPPKSKTGSDEVFTTLLIIALCSLPKLLTAIIGALFFIFGFGKRKSPIVMGAVILLIAASKYWSGFY